MGSVTGNVGGSVDSVTGAVGTTVGSVTGAVGSVTGNVDGSVDSVTLSVGSVGGDVTGNVDGSVGSVVGAVGTTVGSVTGAVGSVTGNVDGSVGSVVGAVGTTVGSVTGAVGSVTGDVLGDVIGNVGTITVTDNESEDEENLLAFIADAAILTGSHSLEMDGDLKYNPFSSRLTVPNLTTGVSIRTNTLYENVASAGITIAGVMNKSNCIRCDSIFPKTTISTNDVEGAETLTAEELVGGFLMRGPSTGTDPLNDTTATAAQIVAVMPGAAVGSSFRFIYVNTRGTANHTLTSGANVTFYRANDNGDTNATVVLLPNSTSEFQIIATNITTSSETVSFIKYGK